MSMKPYFYIILDDFQLNKPCMSKNRGITMVLFVSVKTLRMADVLKP